MAEVIPFAVPTESDKTLLVWELSCGPTAEALHCSLYTVFAQFGLLYSVRVFPNAAVAGPGFYAVIKFYSARAAQRAQQACDQKPLFQDTPVKVRVSTRHNAVQYQTHALNSFQCQELANYYFGFNGWSKRILKLQDLSDLDERGNEGPVVPCQKQSLKFLCAVEVVLPFYNCRSPGVGRAEDALVTLEEGSSFLMKRKTIQKLAIQKAVSDAFQKLFIVALESGKIVVEYRPREDITDARMEEELYDLIQVNDFPWKQDDHAEEECLSDVSFEDQSRDCRERTSTWKSGPMPGPERGSPRVPSLVARSVARPSSPRLQNPDPAGLQLPPGLTVREQVPDRGPAGSFAGGGDTRASVALGGGMRARSRAGSGLIKAASRSVS